MVSKLGLVRRHVADNGDVYELRSTVFKWKGLDWADGCEDCHDVAIFKNDSVVVTNGSPLYFEWVNTGKGGADPAFRALINKETGEVVEPLKPNNIKELQ